jgi:hypothetical protein
MGRGSISVPMYSCSRRPIPSQIGASISPCDFMATSNAAGLPFKVYTGARTGKSIIETILQKYQPGMRFHLQFLSEAI